MSTATTDDLVTLTDLADEANLSLPEAYARLTGFTSDHLDATSPLSDADASMIRTLLAPPGFTDCGCVPTVGHTAPCLLAPPAICPECGTPTLDVDGVCDQSQLPASLPDFDTVDAAGLPMNASGNGPHGTYTWADVAHARASRALRDDGDNDGYTATPTHVRVFSDGQWFVDGADNDGRFTQDCWSFDSHADAIGAIPAFVEVQTLDGAVRWEWDRQRDKAARFVTMVKGPLDS